MIEQWSNLLEDFFLSAKYSSNIFACYSYTLWSAINGYGFAWRHAERHRNRQRNPVTHTSSSARAVRQEINASLQSWKEVHSDRHKWREPHTHFSDHFCSFLTQVPLGNERYKMKEWDATLLAHSVFTASSSVDKSRKFFPLYFWEQTLSITRWRNCSQSAVDKKERAQRALVCKSRSKSVSKVLVGISCRGTWGESCGDQVHCHAPTQKLLWLGVALRHFRMAEEKVSLREHPSAHREHPSAQEALAEREFFTSRKA